MSATLSLQEGRCLTKITKQSALKMIKWHNCDLLVNAIRNFAAAHRNRHLCHSSKARSRSIEIGMISRTYRLCYSPYFCVVHTYDSAWLQPQY